MQRDNNPEEAGGNARVGASVAAGAAMGYIVQGAQLHDTVTDVERAALTILARANPHHHILRAWVEAVITDLDETRDIDTWAKSTYPKATDLAVKGSGDQGANPPPIGDEDKDEDRAMPLFSAILDGLGTRDQADRSHGRTFAHQYDSIILRLAHAVVRYRIGGRPESNEPCTVQEMRAPIGNKTATLALAVAGYVESITSLYATYNW